MVAGASNIMAYYWEDPYQSDNLCVFCSRLSEQTRTFFHSVETQHFSHKIPVHPRCYRWRIFTIGLRVVLVFVISGAFLLFLASRLLGPAQPVIRVPIWIFVVTGLFALLFSACIGIKAFLEMEGKIRNYIDSHTDDEDYYKSDRFPWRRCKDD
jgi:hypothetical protein